MNQADIAHLRLASQQLTDTRFTAAKDLVRWMGAMQAQDYAMAKWAIGIRLAHTTDKDLEAAIELGEILRTHLLRPTWHFVSASDIYWLLELTAPRIKAIIKPRQQELELTEAVMAKSQSIFNGALCGGRQLSREQLIIELERAGIPTNENRASHLLMAAELDGLIVSGLVERGKAVYALLEERIPKPPSMTREAALAGLAGTYFSSHGPATLQDFVWWSGLSAGDAKRALEMAKPGLASIAVDLTTYWLSEAASIPNINQDRVDLIPAYDEYIISYADRQAVLAVEHRDKTISSNGIFRPVIVQNGQVIGLWKRTFKKERVIVETELFVQVDRARQSLIENAARKYGDYLEMDVQMKLETAAV